jgi:hypothetical protein
MLRRSRFFQFHAKRHEIDNAFFKIRRDRSTHIHVLDDEDGPEDVTIEAPPGRSGNGHRFRRPVHAGKFNRLNAAWPGPPRLSTDINRPD